MISEQLKISILKSAKSIWKQICTEQSEKKKAQNVKEPAKTFLL